MTRRADYNIDIFRLSDSAHSYTFLFNDAFFNLFKNSLVNKGSGKVKLILVKSTFLIELKFEIVGEVELICDRSLDPFLFMLKLNNKLLIKFGESWQELSDQVLIMPRNEQFINVAQYIYEFIGVAVPMKKIHPRFKEEDEENNEKFIYSSST